MLIAEHLVYDEALGGKIAGEGELPGLAQHDLRHFAVEPAAEVAEEAVLLVVAVGGIDHVIALLQLAEGVRLISSGLFCKNGAVSEIGLGIQTRIPQQYDVATVVERVGAVVAAVVGNAVRLTGMDRHLLACLF